MASKQLSFELGRFPLIERYLGPSLSERLGTVHWFENRIIRYIHSQSPWVADLEYMFREAGLGSVPHSEEIFSVLQGAEDDYDEQLFDALVEVRLARWARSQDYHDVEKLETKNNHKTPEFRMKQGGKIILAEAKHFRTRDYLVDFVADRLAGLALVTDKLTQFGLQVETSGEYNRMRAEVLKNRKNWVHKVREELNEDCLSSFEQSFGANPEAEVKILKGLFFVKRSPTVGVRPNLIGSLDPKRTVELLLSKLRSDLLGKLEQIKDFKETNAARAIVFFSGIDESEIEWYELWSTLERRKEQWAWDYVDQIKKDADVLIGMPFELIVGRHQRKGNESEGEAHYGAVEYVPFPWKPEGP